MKQISVILPFYNAAPYLDRTLRNIISEQFGDMPAQEWELIAINDGSTDGGEKIVDGYCSRYPGNVVLLNWPNQGVSAARNAGIDAASGEFIYFMDSDDLLLPGALGLLLGIARAESADMMRFGFRTITPEEYTSFANTVSERAPSMDKATIRLFSGLEFADTTRGMLEYKNLWSVWSGLFRADFLKRNGIRFIEGLHVGEDSIFTWECLLADPRMAVVDEDLYLYQSRPDNVTNNTATSHMIRREGSLRMLHEKQRQLLERAQGTVSDRAVAGLKESMTYILQDLTICAIALDRSPGCLSGLMRSYNHYSPWRKVSRRWFIKPNLNTSRKARFKAWCCAKIFFPWHCKFHSPK